MSHQLRIKENLANKSREHALWFVLKVKVTCSWFDHIIVSCALATEYLVRWSRLVLGNSKVKCHL